MLEAWHSQALFTKRTTQRLREHVRWVVLSSNWKNRHVSVSFSFLDPQVSGFDVPHASETLT